jgi:hypothetical protein
MLKNAFAVAAVLAVASAAPASAAVITTLFNTGTNAANVSVGGVGSVDQHWTLADGTAYVSGQNGVFPLGPWIADTAISRWITPSPVAGATLDPTADGTYTYTLTFSLDGYKAATAALSGRFAADNEVLGITLNGSALASSGGGFRSWTGFNSTGVGFVDGLNTLSFRVSNFGQATGNPSGLRVELGGTAAVPEPQAWTMLIAGFGLVGAGMRRRRAVVA